MPRDYRNIKACFKDTSLPSMMTYVYTYFFEHAQCVEVTYPVVTFIFSVTAFIPLLTVPYLINGINPFILEKIKYLEANLRNIENRDMLSETRFEKNGVSKFQGTVNDTKSTRPKIKRITNEWIATCIMFFFSLSILIAKIYINYELLDKRLYYNKQDNLSDKDISFLPDWSNLTGIPDLSESIAKQLTITSRQFINTTNQYAKASADMVIEVSTNYRWLIRALLSGLMMTGFGWFIIYMDSCIPGVDPPISFRLFKRRGYRIQINNDIDLNYLVSAVIGLLVFISTCLDR